MPESKTQGKFRRPVSSRIDKSRQRKNTNSLKIDLPSEGPDQPLPKKKENRSSSFGRISSGPVKSPRKSKRNMLFKNSDNFCLQLLMEYPFNAFFINFVCYIRDSLFNYFENTELNREGKNNIEEKDYRLLQDNLLDFEAQMEPLICILKDMCNTKNQEFNSFMQNIIMRCLLYLWL